MLVFFFQAEDGIRAGRVTGVQTCALPISSSSAAARSSSWRAARVAAGQHTRIGSEPMPRRSEERRVGKECRGRFGAELRIERSVRDGHTVVPGHADRADLADRQVYVVLDF